MGGSLKLSSSSDATTFSIQMVEICRVGKDQREAFTEEQILPFNLCIRQAL